MTVVETDRIKMAENVEDAANVGERSVDMLFDCFERQPSLEGYKIEIVEGTIHMAPQRDTHWQIIRRIVRALEDKFGLDLKITSDVRIDFPGHGNGLAPDIAKLRDDAEKDSRGRWQYGDVELVAEVISQGTAAVDYGPKKEIYAAAEIPVYLIVDPYRRCCIAYTDPKEGEYQYESKSLFGVDVDLTTTPVALTLHTTDFPRD
ncbi:Uma2 family endonuclease [Streptomyces sp. NPDC050560]|uniref:Uma2 family endonuclease n=1 Tax=Streptomyces sp. NPDC050560 TaxID=3365630 RepID=UPI0037AF2591